MGPWGQQNYLWHQTKHFITKIVLQALCHCTFCTILRPGFLVLGGWTWLLLSFPVRGPGEYVSHVTVMWPDQIQNPSSGGIWTWDLTRSHSHANRLTTAPPSSPMLVSTGNGQSVLDLSWVWIQDVWIWIQDGLAARCLDPDEIFL